MLKLKKIDFEFLNIERLIYFLIITISFVFFIKNGVIYYPDSEGYLQMSLIRSCGYPLFINFFKTVFGENYISVLIFAQYFFNVIGCLFITKCLKKTMLLNKWFLIIFFTSTLLPICYEIEVANSILSESIAYPLFLIIVGHLFIAFVNNKFVNFYYAIFLTFLLILIRGQFLFIIPTIIIGFIITNFKNVFKKKSMFLILITVSLPFLCILTDMVYHKTKHNYFITTPWTGIQIATMPIFTSNEDDYKIFKSIEEQNYFKFVYQKLNQKKLLLKQLPQDKYKIDYYFDYYCAICNNTISDDGQFFFNNNLNDDERIILNDKITASLSIPLIKQNFKNWFGIYLRNIIEGIGGKNVLLIHVLLFILSLFLFIKNKKRETIFILICSLLVFGNVTIVALAEPCISRYMFYNNWILITIFLVLFQKSFIEKSNE